MGEGEAWVPASAGTAVLAAAVWHTKRTGTGACPYGDRSTCLDRLNFQQPCLCFRIGEALDCFYVVEDTAGAGVD